MKDMGEGESLNFHKERKGSQDRKTKITADAVSNIEGKRLYLHRLIMNTPEGLFVEHRYHNTLDNRK